MLFERLHVVRGQRGPNGPGERLVRSIRDRENDVSSNERVEALLPGQVALISTQLSLNSRGEGRFNPWVRRASGPKTVASPSWTTPHSVQISLSRPRNKRMVAIMPRDRFMRSHEPRPTTSGRPSVAVLNATSPGVGVRGCGFRSARWSLEAASAAWLLPRNSAQAMSYSPNVCQSPSETTSTESPMTLMAVCSSMA